MFIDVNSINMLVLFRVILIVLVSTLTYGVDKEKITKGIQPIVQILDAIDNNLKSENENKSLTDSLQTLFDHGQRIFPYLKDFAGSMNLLDDKFNNNGTNDQTVKNELDKIKKSFGKMEDELMRGITHSKDNEPIIDRYNRTIHDKFIQLKNVFISFVDNPVMDNKNMLRRECNTTNGMKDVLTDLHIEIVNKESNNGTFNQLIAGGVRNLENI